MTQLWSSAQSSPLISSAIIFVLIIIFREIFIFQSSSQPFIYYFFLFPGIIAHELSHVVVCLITFTRITSIKLFSKTGGFVMHQKPRFILISFLISIAPLVSGLAIIYFATRNAIASDLSFGMLLSAKTVVILYFLSSILITMLPSKQDVLNAVSVYLAIIVGLISYYFLFQNNQIFTRINSLLLFCLMVIAGLNVLIFITNKIWK